MRKIAEVKGLPYPTVCYWMQRYNIPRRSRVEASFYGYWGEKKIFSKNVKKLSVTEVSELYYNKGLSARKIGEIFGRSTWNIYKFMRRNGLARRPPVETNRIIFERKELSFKIKDPLSAEDEKLKTAGVMLYWAEGHKNKNNKHGGTVDFANSEPEMVKVFLKFLRIICGVDENRLRANFYCFADQDAELLKQYWSELTKIPINQFTKPYIKQDFSAEKAGKMKHGLIHIVYSDKKLFRQITNWISEYHNSI